MSNIRIIPLGGVREVGKSLYVVEVNRSIFVLDCGLSYPETEMLGIDVIIPDFTYLEENRDRIVGIFLSHGHADAVGALPYLLEKVNAPVFGTELTIELAKISARDQGLKDQIKNFYTIDEDKEIEFDDATVSFFKTTHSIPDSIGIVVETPAGSIVYTGDFRFDPTVDEDYATNFSRLTQIGDKGVIALLTDSMGAASLDENVSQTLITQDITDTFYNANGRIIVSMIGSNIGRLQQILNVAYATERTVFFSGKDLTEIVDVASKLNKLTLPSVKTIGNMDKIKNYSDNQIVVISTGEVGEPIRALQAMALGRHDQIEMKASDLVYIATSPSVAIETLMAKTKDMVYRTGASWATISDNHKSAGHGTPGELKLMMSFMKPEHVIPVHGHFRQLNAHAELAKELGYDERHIHLPALGDVLSYHKGRLTRTGEVPAEEVMVHGIGVGDIGNVVLRDRRILSEDGIFVVVATISRRLKKVLVGPQISSRGFVYMKHSGDLLEACSDMTLDILEKHLAKKNFDWNDLKSELREKIGKYLFKETKRRPMISPIIMEASNYNPNKKKKGD